MTLRQQGSGREVAAERLRTILQLEQQVAEGAAAALREFLNRLQTSEALTAAVPPPTRLFELGEAAGWWADAVDAHVVDAVAVAWRTGYFDTRDGDILQSSVAAFGEHLANVTDRLSRTATPTIPEQAMNLARVALAEEAARGSSTTETARRLAAEFAWDEDASFWRQRLAEADQQIDAILDPIGPPGSPARKTARLNDPVVRDLQRRRSSMVTRIDRVESTWQQRATLIARTESTSAFNSASLSAAIDEGAPVKRWLCVLPDVAVEAVGAQFAARRRYVGAVVRVATASGARVALTPQHPVLTRRGWTPADDVQQGDEVLRIIRGDAAGTPHVQHAPSPVGEVVDAAMTSRTRQVRTMPAGVDLDSDTADGEVEVVPVDSVLAGELDPGGPQDIRDLFLVGADDLCATFGFGHRRRPDRLDRFGLPAACFCGGSGPRRQDSVAFAGGPDPSRFGLAADGDPLLTQHPVHDVGGASERVADRPGRLAGCVAADYLVGVDDPPTRLHPLALRLPRLLHSGRVVGEPSTDGLAGREQHTAAAETTADRLRARVDRGGDAGGGLAGLVAADEVVHVERDWWDGHVYDLTTMGGWYTADGVVIHNSTADARTRASHLAADGQCVPVTDSFQVGVASMMMPGDPSAPASELVNCRCSMVYAASCDEAARRFDDVADVIDRERERREEGG